MAAGLAHREIGGWTCPARRSAAMPRGFGFADAEPRAGHHEDRDLGEVVDLPLHRPRGALETWCGHGVSAHGLVKS